MKHTGLSLSAGLLLSLSFTAPATTLYVDVNNPVPIPPYTNWVRAAANIQDAIDFALAGDLVLVSNGVYQTGARAVYGMSNRVAVTKPVRVQSVNGPSVTSIVGYRVPGTTNGAAAVRCVYLTNGAVLAGFTLTNGATQSSGDQYKQQCGGGVWCESVSALVSNCVLAGNSAQYYGGGTYYGTLDNCKLTGNSAYFYGGGAYYGTLNNCTLTGNSALFGGGVYEGIVTGSWVCGNSASFGGGAMDGTLESSILSSNYASGYGGGAFEARLLNCTVVGNTGGAGAFAGGRVSNCIIYLNGRPDGIGSYEPGLEPGTINYCCITPLPLPLDGVGNITNAPDFMDASGGDLRLQPNSPCINAGRNTYVAATNDLDGNPRIAGRTVDIGAYEYQSPASALSYAWAQQYGLATDGSADYLDSDHDGMNNWQEWLAGTNPTNAASVLQLQQTTVLPAGMTLTWTSVTNRAYFVERSTNLVPPSAFSLLQTNIPGLPGRTTFTDTTPPASGPAFYRIGVQP